MKKIVFLGASNTYGVGLRFFRDYYLNYDNVNPEYPYVYETSDDKEFVLKNRFSSLLSKNLNLNEANESTAGGSPAQSLYLLSKMNLDEIEYVVFEFSSINSFFDAYFFEHEIDKTKIPKTPDQIEKFLSNSKNKNTKLLDIIYTWLDSFNPYEFTIEVLNSIRDFIEKNKKIKFIILIWRHESIQDILEKNEWLLNYTPTFPILKNDKNIFVETYLTEKKLTVNDEFIHINKIKFPKGHIDLHPSLNGHKKIFEILKSYIDEKNSTNMW